MKVFTKILTVVLAALGFTALPSCGSMYATPSGAFVHLDVTVTDKDNAKPICCAYVTLKVLDNVGYNRESSDKANPDGKASVGESMPDVADRTYRLVVEDTVHGLYESDSVDFKIYTTDFKGGNGKRNKGTALKSIEMKLKKKTAQN